MTREEQLRLEEMKRQTLGLKGLARATRQLVNATNHLDGTIQMYMAYALGLTEDEDEEGSPVPIAEDENKEDE